MKLLNSAIKESQRLRPIAISKSFSTRPPSAVTNLTSPGKREKIKKTSSNQTDPQKVSMRRETESPIELSNGTVLPTGTNLVVSSHRMWDPELYENSLECRGDRFFHMRDTFGKNNISQLVSTGPDHLALDMEAMPVREDSSLRMKSRLHWHIFCSSTSGNWLKGQRQRR